MPNNDQYQQPYTALAEIYDAVMENVDYHVWADFIDDIIQIHHPHPRSILELACGTGALALELNKVNDYSIVGTDKSESMLGKARQKASQQQASVQFKKMDFLHNDLDRNFDIIVCIFDSVNYLKSKKNVLQLFSETHKVMDANSLFIFDFTTPKNSIQAIPYLNNEEGTTPDNYHFFRESKYDADRQIHYNTFEIEKLAGDSKAVISSVTEQHRQRAYSLTEMQEIVRESKFNIVAAYREFDLDEATAKSLRVTMVLQCPNTPS